MAHQIYNKLVGAHSAIANLDLYSEYEGHSGCVNTVQWSTEGHLLVSSGDDCNIKLWQRQRDGLSLAHTVRSGHRGNVFAATTIPFRDHTTVSGGADGDIRLCMVPRQHNHRATPAPATTAIWRCHRGAVHDIACDDQNIFLSVSSDGTARLYDMRVAHECTTRARGRVCTHGIVAGGAGGYGNGLNGLAIHPTERHMFYCAGSGGVVRAYDRRMPHVVVKAFALGRGPTSGYTGPGQVVDLRTGLAAAPPGGRSITGIAISEDGEHLAATYTALPAAVWRTRHGVGRDGHGLSMHHRSQEGEEATQGDMPSGGGASRDTDPLAIGHGGTLPPLPSRAQVWSCPPAPSLALKTEQNQGQGGLRGALRRYLERRRARAGGAAADRSTPAGGTASSEATTAPGQLQAPPQPGPLPFAVRSAPVAHPPGQLATDDSDSDTPSGPDTGVDDAPTPVPGLRGVPLAAGPVQEGGQPSARTEEGRTPAAGGSSGDDEEDEDESSSSSSNDDEDMDDEDGGWQGLASWQMRWVLNQQGDDWTSALRREVLARQHVHAREVKGAGPLPGPPSAPPPLSPPGDRGSGQAAGQDSTPQYTPRPPSGLAAVMRERDIDEQPLSRSGLIDSRNLLPGWAVAGTGSDGPRWEAEPCPGGRACGLANSQEAFNMRNNGSSSPWTGVAGEWVSRLALPSHVCAGHVNVRTVKQVSFLDPHGQYVGAGSDDGFLYCYHVASGKVIRVIRADRRILNGLAPRFGSWPSHATGPLDELDLVTSGIDYSIKLWRPGGALGSLSGQGWLSLYPLARPSLASGQCLPPHVGWIGARGQART